MSEQDSPVFVAVLTGTATAYATHPEGAEVPPAEVPVSEE